MIVPDTTHGELVALGALTRVKLRGKGKTWAVARAPILAYHMCREGCAARGRLVVVTRDGRFAGSASDAAAREFRRTHWGVAARRELVSGRAFGGGEVEVLGTLLSVTYTTVKGGDDGPTDYEHAFEGRKPLFGRAGAVFVILGGSYRVEARGIVG